MKKLTFNKDAWENVYSRTWRDGIGEILADLAKYIPRGIKHNSVFNKIRKKILLLSGLQIGCRSYIYQNVTIVCPSNISIGEDSFINQNCLLSAFDKIKIGNRVSIGYNVSMITESHDYTSAYFKAETGNITIEDGVWIGANSVILKNVTIGEGAVICAGSVVRENVKPYTIVGGVPAKYIKDRDIR